MRLFLKVCIACLFAPMLVVGQTGNQKPQVSDSSDVQLGTTLAQTDLMVFTKDGRFVDNLKREQFELLVNGKPEPISFFELITSGTTREEKQLAAARGERVPAKAIEASPREIGRSIFFFVDDLHLSADSTLRTRKLLLDYVNNQANPNDKVAIVTASGQLGFLQQLCDNKAILRAAINRLTYRAPNGMDEERPVMTESQAIDLQAGDRDILDYFRLGNDERIPRSIHENHRRTIRQESITEVNKHSRNGNDKHFVIAEIFSSRCLAANRTKAGVLCVGWVPGQEPIGRCDWRDERRYIPSQSCRRCLLHAGCERFGYWLA